MNESLPLLSKRPMLFPWHSPNWIWAVKENILLNKHAHHRTRKLSVKDDEVSTIAIVTEDAQKPIQNQKSERQEIIWKGEPKKEKAWLEEHGK